MKGRGQKIVGIFNDDLWGSTRRNRIWDRLLLDFRHQKNKQKNNYQSLNKIILY